MRSLVDLLPFSHEVRSIIHLMTPITTPKATILLARHLTQVFPFTSTPPRPLKSTTTSLWNIVGSPILVPHRKLLNIEPLLRLGLILFILPRPLWIPIHHSMLRVINLLSIDHDSRSIHIIKKHFCTTVFFHKARHSLYELIHSGTRHCYHCWGILNVLGELERMLLHTHHPFMKVNEFHQISLP